MSVIDGLLDNNIRYAASFPGSLPSEPSAHLAVVACMDARLNVYATLGLKEGEAHVIRNAGGVITDDQFKAAIEADTGIRPPWAAEAFADLDADVRQSVARIKASPFIPHKDQVRGFVFDVDTGLLREAGWP